MNIDKITFNRFNHYVILRCEQEGQSYYTYYYTKIHAVLMHMYCTTNVDMPEDFRAELGHFMKEMRIIVVKFIQNRGEKCEVGKSPFPYPYTG